MLAMVWPMKHTIETKALRLQPIKSPVEVTVNDKP